MEHGLVGYFNLVVGLGVLTGREVILYFIASEETSKLLVNELFFVVSHHEIRYLEVGEDVSPNEIPSLGSSDGG